MKRCFEILGISETASKEQIQDAYDRKATRYSGDFYLEDPKYAKKKLKELKAAYKEACRLAKQEADASMGEILEDFQEKPTVDIDEKPTVDIDEDPEEYMKQLYHKHLGRNVNRAAGVQRDQRHRHIVSKEGRSRANQNGIIVLLLGVMTIAVFIGVVSCDVSDINQGEVKTIYEYRESEITDADRIIARKAENIYRLHQEQMEDDVYVIDEERMVTENRPIKEKANQLAKRYWGKDTISEVTDYLRENYEGYPTDSADTTVSQLDTIMIFYGFPTFDESIYDINPYRDVELWHYSDYIDLLLDAYEDV